jgi:glucosyl-3-phosphoglycerate synthase
VAGHHPLLDFLVSFRYPLAGETALRTALAAELPLAASWSLEIGMLCELFRRADPREICQVDGGTGYDHRHHPLSEGGALVRMAEEIAGVLFEQLAMEGVNVTPRFRASVARAFADEAALALRRSRSLAVINGLPFDEAAESGIIAALARSLLAAPRPHRPRCRVGRRSRLRSPNGWSVSALQWTWLRRPRTLARWGRAALDRRATMH